MQTTSACQHSRENEKVKAPGEFEGLRLGNGVRSGALAHTVQFVQRNVKAEEELQSVFGDGSGACVALFAAVQAQSLAHFFEHKLFGDVVAECSMAICCISKGKQK